MQKRCVFIGIGGGTGSGKTTVAMRIRELMGEEKVLMIPMDAYYRDLSNIPEEERDNFNFDHPDAFDRELLFKHIRELTEGRPIDMPQYDYVKHVRKKEFVHVEPKEILILEGILALYFRELRQLMDIKIYVDTPDDIRFIRRLERDTVERGRTPQSVIKQYLETVRPMHLEFVAPTKEFADIIVPEGGYNEVAVEMIVLSLKGKLEGKGTIR